MTFLNPLVYLDTLVLIGGYALRFDARHGGRFLGVTAPARWRRSSRAQKPFTAASRS